MSAPNGSWRRREAKTAGYGGIAAVSKGRVRRPVGGGKTRVAQDAALLSDLMGLVEPNVVHHLPPGTSKWNTIEPRLFSSILLNWKAPPLVSYRVIVDLIGATTTQTGLTMNCELDSKVYPKGICRVRSGHGGTQHHLRRGPRRMELHH